MKTTTADTAPRHENRLARETSPYLLQHAHNPVDWFPWGEEAFAEARRRNVPIFLSIGYSTCYWCHVMERESFEDEATAALLNERMVAIKVDREERPDVDEIYMTACQVFTQLTEGRASGGWPLSVVLEPATLRPFFVGTYFPPREMYGRTSFAQVVTALSDAWMNRRDDVLTQADRLATLVRDQLAQAPPRRAVGDATVKEAVGTLMRVHDREHGGFGGAPKFPQVPYLNLLAQVAWDNATVREALRRTADEMAIGGLFDQVGGGFHRYCVDATWTVPHFEKMLYDNGQLASFYATLVERTGDPYHAETLRRTLDYVLREMTSQEGAFFSAQDAEVDAREGASYVWTPDELKAALGAETEAGAGTGAAPGPAVDPAAERWRLACSLYESTPRPSRTSAIHTIPSASGMGARPPRRPDARSRELGLDATSFAERRAAIDRKASASPATRGRSSPRRQGDRVLERPHDRRNGRRRPRPARAAIRRCGGAGRGRGALHDAHRRGGGRRWRAGAAADPSRELKPNPRLPRGLRAAGQRPPRAASGRRRRAVASRGGRARRRGDRPVPRPARRVLRHARRPGGSLRADALAGRRRGALGEFGDAPRAARARRSHRRRALARRGGAGARRPRRRHRRASRRCRFLAVAAIDRMAHARRPPVARRRSALAVKRADPRAAAGRGRSGFPPSREIDLAAGPRPSRSSSPCLMAFTSTPTNRAARISSACASRCSTAKASSRGRSSARRAFWPTGGVRRPRRSSCITEPCGCPRPSGLSARTGRPSLLVTFQAMHRDGVLLAPMTRAGADHDPALSRAASMAGRRSCTDAFMHRAAA
ncbi:MAG: DUF255 domain-containing protein [Phycisphaerales bacterium]